MKNKILKDIYLILALLFLFNTISSLIFNLEPNNFEKNKSNLETSSEDNTIYYDWIQTWTATYSSQSYAMTSDNLNNIYLGGSTYVSGKRDESIFIKYDSNGIQQFNVTWSGSSKDDEVYAIAVDSLYNIYIAGYAYEYTLDIFSNHYEISQMYLAKFNSTGNYEWNRTWNGDSQWSDTARGLALDSLNNIYIVGQSVNSEKVSDIALIKYNSSGDEQWYRIWDGGMGDRGFALSIDNLDNIYVGGDTFRNGSGGFDMCLIKYDNMGVQLWNSTWGGSDIEYLSDITTDTSNSIYLAGSTISYGNGGYDFGLIKFDSSGIFQWNRTFGESGGEFARTISIDSLDNIYIGGSRGCEIGIVKYDKFGKYELNMTWGSEGIGIGECYYNDYLYGIEFDSSNNIYLGGYVEGSHIYLMKSDPDFGISKVKEQLYTDEIEFSMRFTTYLEKEPGQNFYSDESHKASISYRVVGYQDFFLIALYDKKIADYYQIIIENTETQNQTINIQLYQEINFSYDTNSLFRFYFNYTYTYTYCTEVDWNSRTCEGTGVTSKSGTYLSDYYIINRNGISKYNPNKSSIPSSLILFLSVMVIGVLLEIILFQRNKKRQY